ncbi:hypothetical protein GE21DRAFT_2759 [Neurospora crassa]|uniref:Uncharacterized protein n=1 Tax=Neurospora crassa (strain ATCC 24698 / 74-OR23-1A / CBS 708.71 / DSM 1257 / FGSC 987) TaxID=367110 RepID=Q7RW69_NEUCR|nr:hypothetical protein NCU03499 [Neurospora crassa OR74A]EAA26600.3 hypothetical protein NCU03499 [Neurospora crassa OR74A]KHE79630.1 hypothetical protein GE21DRAFT_2759 [Neurospora crassa]|eukprot:XP_955836.3 hypothetical protein NCU03499 [Neurospora crassa OR74A]
MVSSLFHLKLPSKVVAGATRVAKSRVKKPKPKKTALQRLMAQSKESLQKRTDEQLVVVQALKDQTAAALSAEGLAASLQADNEAMLEAAVPDASPTPGAGTTHKRVRNADSGVGSSVDSI